VAGVAYTVLVVLHVWRILAFRPAVAVDLPDPSLGFGFFTFIVGIDVPGSPPTDTIVPRSSCSRSGWIAWLVPGYMVPWSAVLVYRSRTRRRYCDLRFGWMSWLRQDQGSWLFVCFT
jgi:hypothetical protein